MPPTYYRGCWHVVSRGFLLGYRLLLVSKDRSLRSENLLPPRGVAGSEFPPLPNIPHCCLPEEFGPCLSPNVADHPLRSATDRRLGGPLPHQLPNRTRAHPKPINLLPQNHVIPWSYAVLVHLSVCYSPVWERLLTRYSPVRR